MLRVDTRVDCNSDGYSVLLVGAIAAGVMWVFAVPLVWLVTLMRSQDDIMRTGDDGQASLAAQQYSFLIGSYTSDYYLSVNNCAYCCIIIVVTVSPPLSRNKTKRLGPYNTRVRLLYVRVL